MELQGIIINIMPEQSGEGKNGIWRSQDYIIETEGQYKKKIAVNVFGKDIDDFAIQINERINAHINIESREFNGKWFTTVRAWKVERPAQHGQGLPTPQKVEPMQESGIGERPTNEEINGGLPF